MLVKWDLLHRLWQASYGGPETAKQTQLLISTNNASLLIRTGWREITFNIPTSLSIKGQTSLDAEMERVVV